jgi:hypothetical protein
LTNRTIPDRIVSEQPRYWFPAKRYGWGWGPPVTWQGWVVLAAYAACIGAGALVISPARRPAVFVAYVALLSVLLTAVCWAKGEPPRWRWRKRDRA